MSVAEAEIAPHAPIQPRAYQDYSFERKAEVLALVEANGGNVQQTARDTGIPHQTIRGWLELADRFSGIQNQTKADLDTKLDRTVHRLIDSIYDHDLDSASLGAKSTAFGVVFDKLQLLRGLPTNITLDTHREELLVVMQQAMQDVDVDTVMDVEATAVQSPTE